MPFEILKGGLTLSPRAIFRAAIPAYLQAGLSFNAMIIDWKKYAPTYRRTDMLQDIREIAGLLAGEKSQAGLGRSNLIPDNIMGTFYHDSPAKYRVFLTAQIENRFTHENDAMTLTYYTDEQLSKEEYEDLEVDRFTTDSVPGGWALTSLDFKAVQRSA